jgi:hypothetical protein
MSGAPRRPHSSGYGFHETAEQERIENFEDFIWSLVSKAAAVVGIAVAVLIYLIM